MRERKWENHGGRRKGAGRPTGYDRIVLCTDIDKRKPQSIYCSDLELFYLKGLLPYIRKYRFLQAQAAHEDGWKGKVWNDTRRNGVNVTHGTVGKVPSKNGSMPSKKPSSFQRLVMFFEEWGMDHDIVKDD